jgi:localization factor PodJL
MFEGRAMQNSAPPAAPQAPGQQVTPPKVLPDAGSSKDGRQSGPLVLPVPGGAADMAPHAAASAMPSVAPNALPSKNPVAAPPPNPARQSAPHNAADITGSLPRRAPPPPHVEMPASIAADQPPAAVAPAMVVDKLPATIGGPRLRAAAIAGDASAEFEVATRFAEGHGVAPSDEEAVRWLKLAAGQGLPVAQFRLGSFYEKGIAVKKDLGMARDYYYAAAIKGNGKAMHNLAVLYAEGINGPADYRTAAQWFRKAADHGITDSQYNLAILYARGVGVEQSYADSYKWFALAASKGDNDAAKKRDEVAGRLDAATLAAVKLAVQKWTAVPQPQDAIGIKAPPGGWDQPEHAANSRSRPYGARPLALESKPN